MPARPAELALCHADIHLFNLLVDGQGQLFIVDWDETLLAPQERDLMFIVSGGTRSREEEMFFLGYGETEIDWLALAYYRYEWVVQEIGDYGERVFSMKDVGEATKRDAVRGFYELFEPGDVVDAAFRAEEMLLSEL